jgi:diguanylate cyclase (GGDEF)-like protein/PAS domain S-box-containing protein
MRSLPAPIPVPPSLLRSLAVDGAAEELVAGLTTHTPVGVFMSDATGSCRFVNGRWCELTGLSFDEAMGDGWAEALHPDDRERVAAEWEQAAKAGRDSVISYRFQRPGGSVVWIEGYAAAFRDGRGELVGWVGSCLDVTAYRLAEQALLRERELFSVAFEGAPIGMALLSLDGRFLRANSVLCHSLGFNKEELSSRRFQEITHRDDLDADMERVRQLVAGEIGSYRLDKRYLRKDGSVFWAAFSVALIRDEQGRPLHFVAHIEDIEERKLAEQELRSQAERDPLTGLLNRRRFEHELKRCQRRLADRSEPAASLILLDIDHFKLVNDSFGHQAGDEALVQVARLLERRLRDSDAIVRLGGDEFAVLAQTEAGETVANELLAVIRHTLFGLAERACELRASAGVAGITATVDAATLIASADRALYRAKNSGRDCVAVHGIANVTGLPTGRPASI